jgi:hypothetical protein
MRPDEVKSTIAYDPALDEYCLMYPTEWTFQQTKAKPCHIVLKFEYDFSVAEQWVNFLNSARANGDRVGKLWLKTAGLNLITYELNECLNIQSQPTGSDIIIEFDCLYYDQYVKRNKDVRYETFKPL